LKEIIFFRDSKGNCPFEIWNNGLKDFMAQAKVLAYVTRVAKGLSLKNVRAIEGKIKEIKIDYGPGYRVYFAEVSNAIILLLTGGNKGTQTRDIKKAKGYWEEYHASKK